MDIAKCVRIFEPEPNDDYVAKREAAIARLRTQFLKKRNISDLMGIGSGVCEVFRDSPSLSDALVSQVATAIKRESASFVQDGRDLEMGVCAAAAVVRSFNARSRTKNTLHASDVLAVAVWSALSFLPGSEARKLEEFRLLAVEAARNRILKTGLISRARDEVPAPGALGSAETVECVDALRNNAVMDREELDLLWWVLAGASEIFGQPLQSLSSVARAVTTGIEIGALMRRLPTQSHRNLVVRGLSEEDRLPLSDLLVALGEDRLVIAATFRNESLVDDAPLVFPLLGAIRSGEGAGLSADVPRPLSEWAARALLERAVLGIQ